MADKSNVLKLVPKDAKANTQEYSAWLRSIANDVDKGTIAFNDVLIVFVTKEDMIGYRTANKIRRHEAIGLLTLATNKIASE